MAKDDISLGVEMGRLEIEPVKINKNVIDDNPFINLAVQQKKNVFSRICNKNFECTCPTQKKRKNIAISKKKHNKILKEPVLKLLQNHAQNSSIRDENLQSVSKKSSNEIMDNLSLCALVDNCNQLRISSSCNEQNLINTEMSNETQWWKINSSCKRKTKEVVSSKGQAGSCSQEALNPPCDVTIDELASYFETLVHIPKKMSTMAEMMYI